MVLGHLISPHSNDWGLFGIHGFFLQSGHSYDVGALALFFFEVVFMETAGYIIVGAIAERINFKTFIFAELAMGAIYGNWVWGGGWLSQLGDGTNLGHGAVDFAGSGVVHATGGFAALALAILLGPRLGKFNADGSPNAMPGHNIPFVVIGTFILLFGWMGFNPGSTLGATDLRIAVVIVNTLTASVFGAAAAMMWTGWRYGKPDISMSCNGMLAGLVAITAPCAFVSPWAAALIGFIAGFIVVGGVWFFDAWWSPLVHAMFDTSSGNAIGTLGIGIHNAPQVHNGSAFDDGIYGHVQKDLRQVQGEPVASPWSRSYCGGGNLAACASALWTSLGQAASSLATEFGSQNVDDWKRNVSDDEVQSSAIGVETAPAFAWINRPTFQQVVQINPGCAGDGDCDVVADRSDNCPAAPNASQQNSDRDFIDLHVYGKLFDDITVVNSDNIGNACDPDSDNDGIPDLTEQYIGSGQPGHGACASATANTDALKLDSDGDGFTDRAECTLGTDPASAASKPPTSYASGDTDHDMLPDALEATLGTDPTKPDSDGDKLNDGVEFLYYGSDPLNSNTDGDICTDGKEAASLNDDNKVNSTDQFIVRPVAQHHWGAEVRAGLRCQQGQPHQQHRRVHPGQRLRGLLRVARVRDEIAAAS